MKNGPYEMCKAPEDYPGKRYRGKYCYEHHLVWWRENGSVPAHGEIVHHKDLNKRNNSIDNLELKTAQQHNKEHGSDKYVCFLSLSCPCCGRRFLRARRNSFAGKPGAKYTVCSVECHKYMAGHTRELPAVVVQDATTVYHRWSDVAVPEAVVGFTPLKTNFILKQPIFQ